MILFEQIKQQLQVALKDGQQVLNERILNITSKEDKMKYGQQVYDVLQYAYKDIGGLKGSGFASVEEMIEKIPFWKLAKKDGKIVAAHMYKDKEGRKMVACGSDGSNQYKDFTKRFLLDDLKRERAYMEISGRVVNFIMRQLTDEEFKKYAIPAKKVAQTFPDWNIEIVDEYQYKRKLGSGDVEPKIMFGKLHQPIPTDK